MRWDGFISYWMNLKSKIYFIIEMGWTIWYGRCVLYSIHDPFWFFWSLSWLIRFNSSHPTSISKATAICLSINMPLTEATLKVRQFRFQSLTIPILAKKSLNRSRFSFTCHSRYIIIIIIIIEKMKEIANWMYFAFNFPLEKIIFWDNIIKYDKS